MTRTLLDDILELYSLENAVTVAGVFASTPTGIRRFTIDGDALRRLVADPQAEATRVYNRDKFGAVRECLMDSDRCSELSKKFVFTKHQGILYLSDLEVRNNTFLLVHVLYAPSLFRELLSLHRDTTSVALPAFRKSIVLPLPEGLRVRNLFKSAPRAKRTIVDHDRSYCEDVTLTDRDVTAVLRATKRGTNKTHRDDRVYVGPSKRVPGETGLFASRPYETHQPIVPYLGRRVPAKTAEAFEKKLQRIKDETRRDALKASDPILWSAVDPDNLYTFVVELPDGDDIIDGEDDESASAAKYANAAEYEDEFNTCFVQHGRHILLIARRPIEQDEELLTSYGPKTYDLVPTFKKATST